MYQLSAGGHINFPSLEIITSFSQEGTLWFLIELPEDLATLSRECWCRPQVLSIGQVSLVLAPANSQTPLGLSGTLGEGGPVSLILSLFPVTSI